ncbi:hypothetical protein B0H17DRAFT_1223994 [Mycena rosella]|uniref:Uncharacterized protein n=1 Tax=Mycena rosella TaxID=1033263 RepID=A0AAD7H2P5_MYCRO|nr:hypothetical protein B0H17DRAFT_1223994 [Mycena rosella]
MGSVFGLASLSVVSLGGRACIKEMWRLWRERGCGREVIHAEQESLPKVCRLALVGIGSCRSPLPARRMPLETNGPYTMTLCSPHSQRNPMDSVGPCPLTCPMVPSAFHRIPLENLAAAEPMKAIGYGWIPLNIVGATSTEIPGEASVNRRPPPDNNGPHLCTVAIGVHRPPPEIRRRDLDAMLVYW